MNVFRRVLGLIWLEANNCFCLFVAVYDFAMILTLGTFYSVERDIDCWQNNIFLKIFFIRVSVVWGCFLFFCFSGKRWFTPPPHFYIRNWDRHRVSWHYNLTKKKKNDLFFSFFFSHVLSHCLFLCFMFFAFVLCFRQPSVMYWLNPIIMSTVATRSQFKTYPVVLKYLWNRLLELGR